MVVVVFFFFNDTATTEIYTLSLHDALPISSPRTGKLRGSHGPWIADGHVGVPLGPPPGPETDGTQMNADFKDFSEKEKIWEPEPCSTFFTICVCRRKSTS